MIPLLIGVCALYLFIGVIITLGIHAQYLFTPDDAPTLFESVLIIVGWGVFELIALVGGIKHE